jgi:hypothetical protein
MKNKINTMKIFLIIGLVSFLLFCSSEPIKITGTGSQAGNGKIECLIVDRNGNVFSETEVVLNRVAITRSCDSIIAQWKNITDENGFCCFDSLPSGSFAVKSGKRENKLIGIVSKVYSNVDSIIEVVVDSLVVLKGRLLFNSPINKSNIKVFIPGCQIISSVDDSGFYVLSNVPIGQHDIAFLYDNTINYLPVKISHFVKDTIFVRDVMFALNLTEANSIYSFFESNLNNLFSVVFKIYDSLNLPLWYLNKNFSYLKYYRVINNKLIEIDQNGDVFITLDNFDDGDSLTCLHSITGHSGWQVVTDAKDGGTTKLLPDSTAWHFPRAITSLDAFGGKSLNITFIMGTTPATLTPYSYITCSVSPKNKGYANFKTMKEFSFYLKGKGIIRVVFRSKKALAGYAPADWWGQMCTIITCPTNWQKISIYPKDIKPPVGSKQATDGLTWSAVCDSIDRIEFAAWMNKGDTVNMALDDIVIHGLSEIDFK